MANPIPMPYGCTCSRLDTLRYQVSATLNPNHIYRQNMWQSNTYDIYIWNHITCDVNVEPQLTSLPSW